jgi:tRNA1(Val) A37 N6-methylase TrmN6
MIQARKNSKSFTKVLQPLFVFDDNKFSEEVEDIYKKAKTHSLKV